MRSLIIIKTLMILIVHTFVYLLLVGRARRLRKINRAAATS
jgi:hypothetical protein